MTRPARAKGWSSVQALITVILTLLRFVFVEFRSADDANLALSALHGHPFDVKHTFKVNRFTDIERFANLDETYVEPELEEYAPRVGPLPFPAIYCSSGSSRNISGHG